MMAADTQGDNFEPVGVTDTYATDQAVFHAVVGVANAPSDTKVKAVWTAIDVGDAAPPDTVVDETEISVDGSRNIDFTLASDTGQWPPGTYKVDIYLNEKLDRTLNFSVAE
jgi:outer membrane usher protein FimD/PapC